MDIFTITGLISLILIYPILRFLFRIVSKQEDPLDLIPGPSGLAYFGNAFQIDLMGAHKTIYEWSKQYGDMFKLKMFGENIVVLNDFQSIHEMLCNEDCSSRRMGYRLKHIVLKDWVDVSFDSYSPEWNERKKLVTRSFNAYGTGRLRIEEITLEYIDKLIENISLESDKFRKPLNLKPILHKCIAGIFMTIYYGKKLSESDLCELLETEKGFVQLLSPAEITSVIDTLPIMRFLPIKTIKDAIKGTQDLRRWIIDHHVEGDGSETAQQSVLNNFMSFVNKVSMRKLSDDEIFGVTQNVITAGFITTTSTILSLILVFLNHPEIQEKMCSEIQTVTQGGAINLAEKHKMPYVLAVIEENMRWMSMLPFAVPHVAHKDTTIKGHVIPRNTTLFPNLWKLHHDEKYFPDPWMFKPERYLTEEGQFVPVHHETLKMTLAFGAGKRGCPGEGLGRSRMFLIVTSLLQKFKFVPDNKKAIPSCDPRNYEGALILSPKEYLVGIDRR